MEQSDKNIDLRLSSLESKLDEIILNGVRVSNQGQIIYADEIDLEVLWSVIWAGKYKIVLICSVCLILSIFVALSLPEKYRSQALLSPSEGAQGGGLAGLASQFGGLASLAGVNLGGGEVDKTIVAIETIKSRKFIKEFVERHELLVPLMATKSWNKKSNRLVLDEDIYDSNENRWVRKASPPKTANPSEWEVYKEFLNILLVSQDKKTGLVEISIEFYSPELAQSWVENLVSDINRYVREKDIREAKNNIEYLTMQLEQTSIAQMKTVFSQLIEEQIKTVMLAEVGDEYVFSTIDPAVVPGEKVSPKRSFIVMFSILGGGFLGVLFVLIIHLVKVRKNNFK